MHSVPIDPVPPPFQILGLTTNTIVHQPHMLPGVDAENRLHVQSTGCQVLLVRRVGAHRPGVTVAHRCVWRVGGHVNCLSSGVRGGVGRAGVVSAEDVQQSFSFQVLCQPHEAGSEHGVGRGQEVELQRFNRRAGVDDVFFEFRGDLCGCGGLQYVSAFI